MRRRQPEIGFGHRLRIIRIEYGREIGRTVSQDKFARLLDEKPGTYSGYEAPGSDARPRDLVPFCKKVEAVTSFDGSWLAGFDLDGPDDQAVRPSPCKDDATVFTFPVPGQGRSARSPLAA